MIAEILNFSWEYNVKYLGAQSEVLLNDRGTL